MKNVSNVIEKGGGTAPYLHHDLVLEDAGAQGARPSARAAVAGARLIPGISISRSLCLDIIIAALAVFPFFLTEHLPLLDLPNHLARQYVIRDLSDSPVLQQFYRVEWAFVPNLGLEIFVIGFRQIVSIDNAVRLFCVTGLLLTFLGVRLINRTVDPNSRVYRVTPLFMYSGPLQFGFLNYCFGLGLAAVLFGLYLKYRSNRFILTFPLFISGSILLLLCHLAAFGLYALALLAFEFDSWWKDITMSRQRVISVSLAIGQILIPLLLLFILGSNHGRLSSFHFANFESPATLRQKAEAIAAIFLFSRPLWELSLFAFTTAGVVAALASGVIRIQRTGIMIALFMGAAFLLTPRTALGGGWIDYRLPAGAVLFLLAFVVPNVRSDKFKNTFATWFGLLVVVRVGLIAFLWLAWEPVLSDIDDALQTLPIGARLMVLVGGPPSTSAGRSPPLDHIAALVVARRQGFERNLFADVSGQILFDQPDFRRLADFELARSVSVIDPAYNYLLVVRPKWASISPDIPRTLLSANDTFELFRIDSPAS